jgi:hypothetical protein
MDHMPLEVRREMLRRVASYASRPEKIESRRAELKTESALVDWMPARLRFVLGLRSPRDIAEETRALSQLSARFRP